MATITLGGNYRNTSSAATSAPDTTQEIQGRPAVTGNRPTSSEIAEFEALEYTLPRVPGHLIAHLSSESTSSFPSENANNSSVVSPLILDEISHQREMNLKEFLNPTSLAIDPEKDLVEVELSTGKSTTEVKDAWRKDDNPKIFDLDKLAEKYVEANKSGVNVAKRSFFFKLGTTVALSIAATVLVATGLGAGAGAIVGAIAVKMAADTFCSYMELSNARAKAQNLPPKYDLPMGGSAIGNLLYKGLQGINVKPENCKKWAEVGSLAFDTLFNSATGFALGGVAALPIIAIAQISTLALFLLNKRNSQVDLDMGSTMIDAFKQLQKNINKANAQLQELPDGSPSRINIEAQLNELQDQMNEELEHLTTKIDEAITLNAAPEVSGTSQFFAGFLMTASVMVMGNLVPESNPECAVLAMNGGVSAIRAFLSYKNSSEQIKKFLKQNNDVKNLINELASKSVSSESVAGVDGEASHVQLVDTENLRFV